MRMWKQVLGAFLLCLLVPAPAFAGDGATIVFRSGQMVYINNGYKTIVKEMLQLERQDQRRHIIELHLEGSSFLINVAEVVLVCRDRCSSLELTDVRDPARGG